MRLLLTYGDASVEAGETECVVVDESTLHNQIAYLVEILEVDTDSIKVWKETNVRVKTTGFSIEGTI